MSTASKEIDYIDQIRQVLDSDNWWRLFVDGKRQHASDSQANLGWVSWALREPSSLKKMKDTAKWLFSEEMIHKPFSLELFYEIHQRAFSLDDALLFSWESSLPAGGLKSFGEYRNNTQKKEIESRAKFLQKLAETDKPPVICDGKKIWAQWSKEEVEKTIHKLADFYYESLSEATPESRSKLAIQMAKDVELIHPMLDCNLRVVVTLWLNKELMAFGQAPVIFEDPNDFDNQPLHYLADEVQKGQEAFLRLCETGVPYEDCVPNEQIAVNIRKLGPINMQYPDYPGVFGDHPMYYGTWMMVGLLKQDASSLLQLAFHQPQMEFEDFAKYYTQLVHTNLRLMEKRSKTHYEFINSANKFGMHFLKLFLQSQGNDFEGKTCDTVKLVGGAIGFIAILESKCEMLMNRNPFSYLHPDLCHLSRKEIQDYQIVHYVSPKGLSRELAQLYDKHIRNTHTPKEVIKWLVSDENIYAAEPAPQLVEVVKAILKRPDNSKEYVHFIDVMSYTIPELLGITEVEEL